ncbi:serine/threonine phosphatase [Altericista sp. CCNU0014]|uniref:serine/threonine phosphatase n=1 Tax=Altericista sp. CCNU0014 TaxID=3082949 RepID=UPI00384BC9D6
MTQPLDALESQSIDPETFHLKARESYEFDIDFASDDDSDDPLEDFPTVILPNRVMGLESFGITDVGNSRHHNEDFFTIDNRFTQLMDAETTQVYSRGVYILCDGMGGHAQGEVASRMAAETLSLFFAEHWKEEMPSEAAVKDAIYWANQTLHTLNESQTRFGAGRMGTTLVLAMLQDTQFRFAHVGDSRLYRLTHRNGLEQLTVDHEVGQREIQRGVAPEIAYARPDAYQLTQALGPRPDHALRPDVRSLTLAEDCVFLLCSDGITDNQLLERFQEQYLMPLLDFKNPLEEGLRQLIELANTENGHDNATAIGIRAKVSPQPVPRPFV